MTQRKQAIQYEQNGKTHTKGNLNSKNCSYVCTVHITMHCCST